MTSLEYIEDQTEELCLEAVRINPFELQYAKYKTPAVYEMAIKKDPDTIRFVDNPSEELCWTALKKSRSSINSIKNPTDEMIEYALKERPHFIKKFNVRPEILIEYLHHLSDKQLLSLKQYLTDLPEDKLYKLVKSTPKLIKVLEDPAYDLVMCALNEDPHVIEHIPNPSDEMIDCVIGKTPHILLLDVVRNRSDYEFICWVTLAKYPHAIEVVEQPTEEMIDKYVDRYFCLLQDHYTEERAWKALRRDSYALNSIKEPTIEMFEYVLEHNAYVLQDYPYDIPAQIKDKMMQENPLMSPELSDMDKLKLNPDYIIEISNPTQEMEEYVIDMDPENLIHTSMTEELCMRAFKLDASVIFTVMEHDVDFEATDEMIDLILRELPDALWCFPQTRKLIEQTLSYHPESYDIDTIIDQIEDICLRLEYRNKYSK